MRAVSGHEPTPPVRREGGGAATADALLRDTRHALRRLLRDWRFTAAAVLILGLGIGANTAIFSLINATLFRQQSLADPDRLVDIYQNASNAGGIDGNSYPAYLDMAAYTDVFASTTAALVPTRRELPGRGRPAAGGRRTHHRDVSVRAGTPAVARALVRRGGGHARRRGGGRRRARGLDEEVPCGSVRDRPHHPDRRCAGHDRGGRPGRPPRHDQHRHRHRLLAADLVAPGARSAAAHAGAASGGGGVLREGSSPGRRHRRAGAGRDGHPGHAGWQPSTRRRIRARALRCSRRATCAFTRRWTACWRAVASLLLVVVGLVLAIACSNLATLLLVRGTARAKEVSVRLALGATRGQLVRHLLTESLLLSLAGGIAGCLLAWWAIRSLGALDLPIVVDLSLDYRVLIFAVAHLARHRRGIRPRAGAQGHAGSTWCRRCATMARRDRRTTAGSRSRTRSSCSRWRCRSCCLAEPASSSRC